MFRTTTSNLLIAVVLVCPYLCAGKAMLAVAAPCQTSGRSCCGDAGGTCDAQNDCSTPANDKAPKSPVDHGSNCLCHGSIMDGLRATDVEFLPSHTVIGLVDRLSLSAADLSLATVSFKSPHQFPPLSCGRDVCVQMCILLL